MNGRAGGGPAGVVFTDLDGTLLDHNSYSYQPARRALGELGRQRLPLVLCSSKTRAEMVALQAELQLDAPLIVENGGGIFAPEWTVWTKLLPEHYRGVPAKVFGTAYPALREGLAELRTVFGPGIQGFGDTDVAGVARWTGLPARQARLAARREFDEPFLWQPDPTREQQAEARRMLWERGLQLTRGGRFWHVVGNNDKGRAVSWLLDRWQEQYGFRPASLGLGDSENDLPMLTAVDRGVLVERAGRGHLTPRPPGIATVEGEGPVGWNRAVLEWLEDLPDTTRTHPENSIRERVDG